MIGVETGRLQMKCTLASLELFSWAEPTLPLKSLISKTIPLPSFPSEFSHFSKSNSVKYQFEKIR